MNASARSHEQLMEELLSLEALLRLMKGRDPSEWMVNNVMSLLYSLKSRAFLAQKLTLADIIHFMQKALIELPFHAAHDMLLSAVDICIKVFEDADAKEGDPGTLFTELMNRYEEYTQNNAAFTANVLPMRR